MKLTPHSCSETSGTTVYWGTMELHVPQGGNHVRQGSIFLPPMSKENSINLTIYSPDSNGQTMTIWSIKKVYEKDYTQFGISATGARSDFAFVADFQVIAKI